MQPTQPVHPRTKYYADAIEKKQHLVAGLHKGATLALFHLLGTSDLLHGHFTPRVAEWGVSLAGWNVLNLLNGAPNGARPMHELSQLMLVSRQNITQLVDGLEKKKLVHRIASKEDGRVKLVEILKAGKEIVEKGQTAHYQAIREVFDVLRDPELELLGDYLLRIQGRLLELKGSPVTE